MTGDTDETPRPLPGSSFHVVFGSGRAATFQQVTGLVSGAEAIDSSRAGGSGVDPISVPGLARNGTIQLRKGIFVVDDLLWNWFDAIAMNTITRDTVVVTLLDEHGAATYVWTLDEAFPTRITGTDLESEGNEVAVESVDVAFETMTISLS